MKQTTFGKTIVVLLFFFALQLASGCNRIGEAVEFQLWSGNVTLPPQYQREQVIRGKITPNSVTVSFSDRKGENEVERNFELTGEDYKRCVEMIRNTSLEEKKFRAGSSSFDVMLIDGAGKNEMGMPSNRDEWVEFANRIEQMTKVK